MIREGFGGLFRRLWKEGNGASDKKKKQNNSETARIKEEKQKMEKKITVLQSIKTVS